MCHGKGFSGTRYTQHHVMTISGKKKFTQAINGFRLIASG